MYDSSDAPGGVSYGLRLTLGQSDGTQSMTPVADSHWLQDSVRCCPVTIDPSLNLGIVTEQSTGIASWWVAATPTPTSAVSRT